MKQHSDGFLSMVAEAKKHIKEISPLELRQKLDAHKNMHLIDVREDNEWITGCIPSAVHLGKGIIERDIEKTFPNKEELIIVYCSGGNRSALVAERLQTMGYSVVYSLESGLQGWLNSGYSVHEQLLK